MAVPESVRTLEHDLRSTFGPRFLSLVIYRPALPRPGEPVHTLATVQHLHADDLRACAQRAGNWHDSGLATPLIIPAEEFGRALDAFPLEFGAILADHDMVAGADPFAGLVVHHDDIRRACEVQLRSHLLHLREGYMETRGRGDALVELIADSVAPLAGLLMSVTRLLEHPAANPLDAAHAIERTANLGSGSLADVLRHTPGGGEHARRIFVPYLAAVEGLTRFVDRWSRP